MKACQVNAPGRSAYGRRSWFSGQGKPEQDSSAASAACFERRKQMKSQASGLKVLVKFIPHALAMIALLLLLLPSVSGTQNGSASPESREIVPSQELLEGTPVGGDARYVYGDLRAQESSADGEQVYQETFRVDPSVTDSIAPAS